MMKKVFVGVIVALFISITTFAQVATSPEVPRNYKPKPKEMLPMPGPLTDEAVFPVLGKYEITNKTGEMSNIEISKDADSKGVVWVTGFPQGKFKAYLKESPATYKIPSQGTLKNEGGNTEEPTDDAAIQKKHEVKKKSGKSVDEGTLIYDKDANKIYVNLGGKFNEAVPNKIFPEMLASADSTTLAPDVVQPKKKISKKPVNKGLTYTGTKIMEGVPADVKQ